MTTKTLPVAPGLPLLGSLIPMVRDTETFLARQYRRLGPCYRVKILGQSLIVVGGPTAAETMTNNTGEMDAWDTWEGMIREFGGRQVLTMLEGADHLKYRAAARNGFAKSRVLEQLPLIMELTHQALDQTRVSGHLKVVPFAQRLVADCIGTLTLGRRPGPHLNDFITYWHAQLAVHIVGSARPSSLRRPAYLKAQQSARAIAQDILDQADTPEGLPALSSTYVADLRGLMTERPDLLNRDELLFMMLIPYMAGLDTVVSVFSLCLYELYRRPEILARVQAEAHPLVEAGLPAARLRELKVLHAVVLEVMRLHPIANNLPHTAKQDFEIQGFPIKKGEKLLMALFAAQRNPELFAEPDRFDIDRFLEPRHEHKQKGAFQPYGAGAHTCLGAGMAEALLATMLATTVTHGRFELFPKDFKMKPFHSANLSPDARLTLRRLE
ncbi:cytochrome P450 [Deinococcus psychrotolerans]|uniref:Cytochrome P450 n=1 Tax=Deinococcus psychrotolerans TaxID=2489213 RepID=A0A3G8YCZ5_9DEIO|nr:cytochrome P450 [Deinococcus psychrotolerans]AZI42097.1 cytochrome P450 [Deinococcus psychrotolerans]